MQQFILLQCDRDEGGHRGDSADCRRKFWFGKRVPVWRAELLCMATHTLAKLKYEKGEQVCKHVWQYCHVQRFCLPCGSAFLEWECHLMVGAVISVPWLVLVAQ